MVRPHRKCHQQRHKEGRSSALHGERFARRLSQQTLCNLLTTSVRVCLSSVAWGLSTSDELALEKIQASVARRLLLVPWMTPKSDMFKELDWPTLRWRRAVCCVVLFCTSFFTALLNPLHDVSSLSPLTVVQGHFASPSNSY